MRKLTSVFKDIQYKRNTPPDHITINDILIRNTNEEEWSKVKSKDTVKVPGAARQNKSIEIQFEDQKYTSLLDRNKNWFVTFYIQNINPGSYPVNIYLENSKCTESLIHLVVQKDIINVEDTNL